MSIISGHGWQTLAISQLQKLVGAAVSDAQAYQPDSTGAVAAVSAVSGTTSSGNTSNQAWQDAQDEAFAKLKVALQNPGGTDETRSSALQEFRDYMALSPEEKIRERMLSELGLTKDEYEALPPEEKDKIDKLIAERTKDETELKSMASLQPVVASSLAAQSLVTPVSELQATDPAQWRQDKENRLDPLNR